jgi:cation:H+ antiporter
VVISAKAFRSRREQGDEVEADVRTARRDLRFFLALFALGIAVGAIGAPLGVRIATAVVLVGGYIVYATRTVRRSGDAAGEEELKPLMFDPTKDDPPSLFAIIAQFLVSLAAIIVGAELFVHVVEAIAEDLGLSTLVLALVLAPIATELPEKVNSVVWMRDGKDELAVGNVTGAMTFQATIPVVFGLVLTSWDLDRFALAAACAALAGGALALWAVRRGRFGLAPGLAWGALFGGFVVYAMTG